VAVALLTGAPVPVVVLATALLAVVATPSYPALAAATPECVPDDVLPPANALVTCVENVTWIAGAGVFGLLTVAGAGPREVALVAALMYAVAALAALPVRTPRPVPSSRRLSTDLLVGVGLVARRPAVRRPMLLAVVDNLLYGYLVVALVLLTQDARSAGDRLGWLNTALTLGALASTALVTRLTARRPATALVAGLAVFSLSVVALGLLGPTAGALLVVLLAGATTLLAEVAAVTLLQRGTEPEALARVFGIYDQLNVGAIAAGSALAGPAAAALGTRPAVALAGVVGLLAVLPVALSEPGLRPPRRQPGRRGAALSGHRAERGRRVPAA
jgi:MFS family permease